MGVAGNEIDILARDVEFWVCSYGYVFPPSLGGFAVVNPGAG